jgi:hypothetical protein
VFRIIIETIPFVPRRHGASAVCCHCSFETHAAILCASAGRESADVSGLPMKSQQLTLAAVVAVFMYICYY